jgi:uncharacterized phage infection (PIP) family protein YhgE
MLLSCLCGTLCGETDLKGLRAAGSDCHRLAAETVELAVGTEAKCQNVIDFAQDVKANLTEIGTKMNPSSFMAVMEYQDKMKDTMALAGEMDSLAGKCVDKSTEMSGAMQRGVDSLPQVTKDGIEEMNTEDESDMKLLDLDKDIKEIENCTESLRNMDIFSVATSGSSAFGSIVNKGGLCKKMFERVEELSTSIARITQAFMQQSGCAQIQAALSETKNMLRCISLSSLMTKIAKAARRLIQAIFNLLSTAWNKFKDLLEQFGAAKKIKNFVNGISPFRERGEKGANASPEIHGEDFVFDPDTSILCCGFGSGKAAVT